MRRALAYLFFCAALLAPLAASHAQQSPTAVTLTPDRRHLLVNKQLGPERWSISMNLGDGGVVVDVAGEVFDAADAADASFVHCAVRPDSTGSLDDPSSLFRLTCRGTGGCSSTALACARGSWQSIARDVEVPASFFLPPSGLGGDGASALAALPDGTQPHGTSARVSSTHVASEPPARPRVAFDPLGVLTRLVSGALHGLAPTAARAQTTLASATLSPNLLSHLVVRDFSGQRWSIAFHMVRDDSRAGGFKPSTVTGNVFGRTQNPAFVYCVPRSGTAVSLEDPALEMQFLCFGTSACTRTALECADAWTSISNDLTVAAGFFLPAEGRGTPGTSEASLMVLGGVDGVPALVSEQFQGSGSATCTEGEACIVDRIGLCENVRGRKTSVDGTCRCFVAPVSPYCVRTGTEQRDDGTPAARIPAACGEACTYEVGVPREDQNPQGLVRDASGVSLPLFADSPTCFCHANPPGRFRAVETCGGVEGDGCSDGRCCVDDPRDGCDPLAGDAGCSGICIAAASDGGCGVATLADQFCGDGVVSGSEVCDPQASPAPTCTSLGFSGGTLDCSTCVPRGCTGDDVAPSITSLDELPDEIDAYGRHPVRGRYFDPDGDLVQALLVNGDRTIAYDVAGAGRRNGVFEVAVGCNGRTDEDATIDFELSLRDAAGNESEPVSIEASCIAPPVCGDGVEQEDEECDLASPEAADACGEDEVCANDCTCQAATSCRGRCCPTLDGFCGHDELACRCDPGCRDRGDCCSDAKAECGL